MNLDKKIEQFNLDKAPELLDLSKRAATIATKYGLDGKPARTAVLLDYSGSMEQQHRFYSSGQVQALITRIAALAVLFDDDGQIDLFVFHTTCKFFGSFSPLEAIKVVQEIHKNFRYGGTEYGNAFEAVHDYYWPNAGNKLAPIVDKNPPVYLTFITDGATENRRHATQMIQQLSFRPCFVQAIALGFDYDSKAPVAPVKKGFLGFGGGSSEPDVPDHVKYLMKLDENVPNRHIDNFAFFGTKTPDSLDVETFFSRMMSEYPDWLVDPKVFTMLGQSSAKSAWA